MKTNKRISGKRYYEICKILDNSNIDKDEIVKIKEDIENSSLIIQWFILYYESLKASTDKIYNLLDSVK